MLEAYATLRGLDTPEDFLRNPEEIEKFERFVRSYVNYGYARVDNVSLSADTSPLELLIGIGMLFLKPHPMVLEALEEFVRRAKQQAKAEEAGTVAATAVAVRELKPPKAVDIVLSKLEAAKEMAAWAGGVDIRALKKILHDVRVRKKIVEEAFRFVKEWERGNKEAFFEGYMHLKNVPESVLGEYGLVGDLERLRRAVASGGLKPADAGIVLTALYAVYSMAETHLTEFLSGIEEHADVEHGALKIKLERLEEHVIKPLREKLRSLRPVIRGDFDI